MEKNKIDVLLVSFDAVSNDKPIMVVGRKNEGDVVNIVNAFQDEEALELYKKLTTGFLRKDV